MGFFQRLFSFGSFLARPLSPLSFTEEQRTAEQLRTLFLTYVTFFHDHLSCLQAFCVEMNTCVFVDQNFLVGLTQVAPVDRFDLSQIPAPAFLTLSDFHRLVDSDVLLAQHEPFFLSHLVLSDALYTDATLQNTQLRERLVTLSDLCLRIQSLEEDYALAQQLFSQAHALLVDHTHSLFSLYRFVHRKLPSRVPRPDWFLECCHLEYWLSQDAPRQLKTFILWMEEHVATQVA